MLARPPRLTEFWPTLAVLIVAVLTFSLGQWQTGRAQQKETQHAAALRANQQAALVVGATLLPAELVAHRKVILYGAFLPNSTIYLDNRFYKSQPGVHVLTAFQPNQAHAPIVMVNRGWMPLTPQQRSQVHAPPPPSGMQRIEGYAQTQIPSYWNLGASPNGTLGSLWPNFGFETYARLIELPLQTFVVLQTDTVSKFTADALIRDWPTPGSGAEKHRGYAFQWYALCLLTIGLWLWKKLA